MSAIKFIVSLIVTFFIVATLGAAIFAIDWPWDGKGVIGFAFTLVLFVFGALPVLIVQRRKLGLSERPLLMGLLFGLVGYPLAYGTFAGFAELLRPLQFGQWFWPTGLICLSFATISVCCLLITRVIASRLDEKKNPNSELKGPW